MVQLFAELNSISGNNEKGTNHSFDDLSPSASCRLQLSNLSINDLRRTAGFIEQLPNVLNQ